MNRFESTKVEKKSHVRWYICAMLFALTAVNYADHATLSLAGPAASKELGMNSSHWAIYSRLLVGPMWLCNSRRLAS